MNEEESRNDVMHNISKIVSNCSDRMVKDFYNIALHEMVKRGLK